jgi:hypothetical protein
MYMAFLIHQALTQRVISLVEPLWATGAWLAMVHQPHTSIDAKDRYNAKLQYSPALQIPSKSKYAP